MGLIKPYQGGEELLLWTEKTVRWLYDGLIRESGKPWYTHFEESKTHMEKILKKPGESEITGSDIFYIVGLCVSLMHDLKEDANMLSKKKGIDKIDVYNPYDPPIEIITNPTPEGAIYLNDLLQAAGEIGRMICYGVHKITKEKRPLYSYVSYLLPIYTFPKTGLLRKLGVITGLCKTVDRHVNTNPDEEMDPTSKLKKYKELKDADIETLIQFYTDNRILSGFKRINNYKHNEEIFREQLMRNFDSKQMANARDNLNNFFPLAEERLIVMLGVNGDGRFDEERMDKKITFHYKEFRRFLKMAYRESNRIAEETWETIRRSGFNHGQINVPGYVSILEELEAEDRQKTRLP